MTHVGRTMAQSFASRTGWLNSILETAPVVRALVPHFAFCYRCFQPQVSAQTLLPGTSVVCADVAPKTDLREEKAVVEEQVADAADVQDGGDPPAPEADAGVLG